MFAVILAMLPHLVLADTVTTGETINTLDYFISKHPDKTLGGSHNQNQFVTGDTSYYVKWAADAFEVHTWDNDNIYLREDHSWKYTEGYAFRPGIWMKRSMQVGEKVEELTNAAYYFSTPTCSPTSTVTLPYTNTLEQHIPTYDLGGDLDKQDVIVLKYDYSTTLNPGNFEKFYYSKEWGWVKWEMYQQNTLAQTSIFNKINSNPTTPQINASCTHGGTVNAQADSIIFPAQLLRILNGQVVKTADNSTLYYITQESMRVSSCPKQLQQDYGISKQDALVISQEELDAYPPLNYVRAKSSVYKLEGLKKRLVKTSAFKKYAIAPDALPQINLRDISCYKTGSTIR